jgi:hypothetical protein
MSNSEFVLEFLLDHIACKNTNVRASPVIVTIPGSPAVMMNAKSASVCKIVYGKGKRISFTHSHITNLQVSFVMVHGHGDLSARASASFDFFALVGSLDEETPTIYDLEVGMNTPNGEHFGELYCSFQLMRSYAFREALAAPKENPRTAKFQMSESAKSRSVSSSKRIAVSRQDSPRVASARPEVLVPELHLAQPGSGRSNPGSIHERYMKKNEMWVGHHCSTHSDAEGLSRRLGSRGSSALSSGRAAHA